MSNLSKKEMFKHNDIQKQYNIAQELVNFGSWTLNLLDNTQIWSDGVYRILGEKEQSFEPSFDVFMNRMDKEDQIRVQSGIEDALSGKKDYDVFHNILHKNGNTINVHAKAKVIYNEDNIPVKLIGIAHDITEQTKLQQESKNLLLTLNSVIDNVDNLIFYKDINFVYMGCNHAFEKFMGHTREELVGSSDFDFFSKEIAEHFRILDKKTIAENKRVVNAQWVVYPDGKDVYLHTTTTPFYDDKGGVIGLVGNAVDITREKNLSSQLEYEAHHDALTGLPNRILFYDRLSQAIEKAKRNNSKFALLFIDLDHFKEINDLQGHVFGDSVLKIVASKLKKTIRNEDTTARLGGDEFIVLLEGITKAQSISSVANKIIDILAEPMSMNDENFYVTSSIGISIYPDDSKSAQSLLEYADLAMYKAKSKGRNNYQYHT